ncbi:hypothetical protein MGWOODY_Tha1004 [hydrothermal vent metagenome]|uniref:Uncharacterized protein n=1 Tax=hydrothermal vent metagenome TaxID=652676 RepID=A0A160T7T8_9ZZZZ
MSYVQNYPLLPPLPKIERHDQLPDDAVVLGELRKGYKENNPNYIFIKRENFLTILSTYVSEWKGEKKYKCWHYDFPLKVLSWFPKALADFQRPPAAGGLHAGAMISKDEDVDGEMLTVGSTTRGYALKNRSRDSKGVDADPDYYEPTSLSLDYELLNDFGLLRFWKDLGDKYEKGLL